MPTRVCLVFLFAACASAATTGDEDNLTANEHTPHIVPMEVHKWLQHHDMGQHHLMFHVTRHYFIGGNQMRAWLDGQHEKYANLQEGDPGSGIEFLAMHRSMIQYLRDAYGDLAITDDPEYQTFGDVLDGWKTDDMVLKAIDKYSTNKAQAKAQFPAAAAAAGDFDAFASDDAFGLFIQTTLRLSDPDPNDSFTRIYTRDADVGAGIHNTLHGWFQDPSSPIDVGDPSLNLSNKLFWGIHGWIEAKWQAYEAKHPRTAEQQKALDDLIEKFSLQLAVHDHDEPVATPKGLAAAPRDPHDFKDDLLSNTVDCANVLEGVQVEGCQ